MTDFVFIGGMGRSGTHLLRSMLDSHPEIAAGPEFDPFPAMLELYREMQSKCALGRISAYINKEEIRCAIRDLVESCIGRYGAKTGKRIVVEKTPSNIWAFPVLFELFPSAKFIHLVRDGRDVVCSHLEVGKRFVEKGLTVDTELQSPLVSIYYSAGMWTKTIKAGFKVCGPDSPLVKSNQGITLRYTDLVLDPESTMRKVCHFIGVKFDNAMLNPEKTTHDLVIDDLWVTEGAADRPITAGSVDRWKRDLSGVYDRVIFASTGQEGLRIAGYEANTDWVLKNTSTPPSQIEKEVVLAKKEIARLQSEDRFVN